LPFEVQRGQPRAINGHVSILRTVKAVTTFLSLRKKIPGEMNEIENNELRSELTEKKVRVQGKRNAPARTRPRHQDSREVAPGAKSSTEEGEWIERVAYCDREGGGRSV